AAVPAAVVAQIQDKGVAAGHKVHGSACRGRTVRCVRNLIELHVADVRPQMLRLLESAVVRSKSPRLGLRPIRCRLWRSHKETETHFGMFVVADLLQVLRKLSREVNTVMDGAIVAVLLMLAQSSGHLFADFRIDVRTIERLGHTLDQSGACLRIERNCIQRRTDRNAPRYESFDEYGRGLA